MFPVRYLHYGRLDWPADSAEKAEGNKNKDGVTMEGATILQAFGYYLIRLVMFTAVAAAGIAVGIKMRKNKNAKEDLTEK